MTESVNPLLNASGLIDYASSVPSTWPRRRDALEES